MYKSSTVNMRHKPKEKKRNTVFAIIFRTFKSSQTSFILKLGTMPKGMTMDMGMDTGTNGITLNPSRQYSPSSVDTVEEVGLIIMHMW